MKRIALVFFLAILLPSILLAVMAIRSVRDQSLILNSQRAMFYQSTCDSVAAEINLFMDEVRVFHGQLIDELARRQKSGLVETFDEAITDAWSQAAVGAVVSSEGIIISPLVGESAAADSFLANHRDFLMNERTVEVYQAPPVLNSEVSIVEDNSASRGAAGSFSKVAPSRSLEDAEASVAGEPQRSKLKVGIVQNKLEGFRFEEPSKESGPELSDVAELRVPAAAPKVMQQRNVMPTQSSVPLSESLSPLLEEARETQATTNVSRLSAAEVKSTDLIAAESGAVSRLIDGELHILLWEKSPRLPGYTFWTELDLQTIREDLELLLTELPFASQEAVSVALLDSDGEMVTQTEPGFTTDWSLPFVASEVGQILPRWEVATYFLNPDSLNESARTLRWTLSLIVVSLLVAVAVGSFLILKAVRYEMQLATRKTDFVSNVSHELKTPLTSIRMFSELLARGGEADLEKTRNYAGIVHKESERLSRLINRLLDFSRLDRDEMTLKAGPVDLSRLVKDSVATFEMQLEADAMNIQIEERVDQPLVVIGDQDALEQVILNLLSNAGKYAADGGEIRVVVAAPGEEKAVLRVEDRGKGVPRSLREKVFEKFYRIDDSIHAGVDGSGIGLALSRQLVEKHGGEIRCEPRDGGGSSFVIELPLRNPHEEE
ncbi:MAG: HAMP domain-containing sensor histidine kinase [Verrucomicrobiales bacterium]|nr:HAMP domain-containing sensor histidine kinase [Verrucomicrobiales bacterium]